eukprot:3124841-Alexandrium_andersonii.AAC.1
MATVRANTRSWRDARAHMNEIGNMRIHNQVLERPRIMHGAPCELRSLDEDRLRTHTRAHSAQPAHPVTQAYRKKGKA